jgi:chromosomal replication initiation ATPase DnaA
MPKLDNILKNSGNTFFKILTNWTGIAGKSNREIMKPVRISKSILYIAVPNSMVMKTVKRFQSKILQRIQKVTNRSVIKEVKFFCDPSKFKETSEKFTDKTPDPVIFDEKEVQRRNGELLKMGIDSSLSKTMAEIDFILKKKKRIKE